MYLYAIGIPKECVKFGISNDPRKRMGTLQVAFPLRLTLIHQMPMPNRERALQMERRVHLALSASKVGGEWFQYSPRVEIVLTLMIGPMISLTAQLNRWGKEPVKFLPLPGSHLWDQPTDFIGTDATMFPRERYRRRFQ